MTARAEKSTPFPMRLPRIRPLLIPKCNLSTNRRRLKVSLCDISIIGEIETSALSCLGHLSQNLQKIDRSLLRNALRYVDARSQARDAHVRRFASIEIVKRYPFRDPPAANNRKHPLSPRLISLTIPIAALCVGETDKSAAFISQT